MVSAVLLGSVAPLVLRESVMSASVPANPVRQRDPICADCGGFDLELMRKCQKHRTEFCRGCECPDCNDDFEYDADPLHGGDEYGI